MTPGQHKTAKRLGIFAVCTFALLVGLLFIEIAAVDQGDHSTISELMWNLWATQPWIVLVVSHLIVAPASFLCGHFFAQSRGVYDRIRRGEQP